MQIFLAVILLLIGIVFIVKGGDIFVDSAAAIAEISGIPKLIVGATIVSFATTMPEMLVSCFAAHQGKTDMAIGNAVGSVTANVGLIMALGMIFMPSIIKRGDYLIKSVLMIASALAIVIFGKDGEFSLIACIIMICLFAAAAAENIANAVKSMKSGKAVGEKLRYTKKDIVICIIKFILGAAMTVIGAELLVDNGSLLAIYIGVPERLIAITAIAVGTSLPELVTTITAIRKHESALGFGNVIGANIIDLSLIMPLCSFISGGSLPVTDTVAMIDLPACLIVCAVAIIPALIRKKFSRAQGIILLVIYIGYIVLSCFV